MAILTYQQLLLQPVVTRVMSAIKTPMTHLQDFFGAGPGGPNVNQVGGHYFGWDQFDRTRKIATGRAPGAGPATATPQVLGHVNAQIYRSHEKIVLLDERVFRTRPLGQYGNVDVTGNSYIQSQLRHQIQKFRNNREFMLAMMLRGGFDLLISGEDWIPVALGDGTISIDYNMPAGNKTTLDMLGAGAIIPATAYWSDPATSIVTQRLNINAAGEQLHGYPYRHWFMNSTTFGYMLNNIELKDLGGIANPSFTSWQFSGKTSAEGIPDTSMLATFKGLPDILVHVTDYGLDINGTFTKLFPSGRVAMLPDVDTNWFEMIEGSELQRETVADAPKEVYGFAAWAEPCTQPPGQELIQVDNCIPAVYLNKVPVYATVA